MVKEGGDDRTTGELSQFHCPPILEANMKICLVSASLYSPPTFSGIEAALRATQRGLVRNGHQVSVITTKPGGIIRPSLEEIDGARVYSFYPWNVFERSAGLRKPLPVRLIYHAIDQLWNPQTYLMVRGILSRERPDVVHVQNWRGFSPSLFDAVRSLGIPVVLSVNDYSLICPRSSLLRSSGEGCTSPPPWCRLYGSLRRLAVSDKPDIVIGISQFVIDKLREFGFFKNTPVTRLFYGIELDSRLPIAKDYGTIHILYVGKLIRIKGVHVLIEAFKQLRQDNIKLHIAGEGEYAAPLRQIAGADSRIVFHGFLPSERLALLRDQASVAVVPSIWHEPFGMVIIESFKHGIPVIGSTVGGIPELIEDGHNGLLFPAGNAGELRDLLQGLIEAPLRLERLSQAAFESASKYDVNHHVARLVELYEPLVTQQVCSSEKPVP